MLHGLLLPSVSQQSRQKKKAWQQVAGLHPSTSGIYTAPVCMEAPQTGTYQLPSWRECRSLHLSCTPKSGVLDMSLCFSRATCPPLPAETPPETVPPLSGCLNFRTAPTVPQNLSRSLRNTSTLTFERPVMHTNVCQPFFQCV